MLKRERKGEGIPYEAPKIKREATYIDQEVKEELAGPETFLLDSQGFKRAYETKTQFM